MSQKVMTHVVQPNGSVLRIYDHGRAQANGVATLDNQGKLVQSLASIYAIDLPSPNTEYNLALWVYKQLTA